MINQVINIIKYESESYRVDFKREQYDLGKHLKRNELLKDLMAFANHPSGDDKFIIVGIKEDGGTKKKSLNSTM